MLVVASLATLAVPAAAPAAPTGSITGTVTSAATHLPIAGVRVCATSEGYFEEVEEFCAHSAANGAYSIGELPEARYMVEFISAVEGLNYVYQAWKGKPAPITANRVKVTIGEVAGIDASLEEGGMIGGRVTSFSSGASVAGVEVCAEPASLYAVTECATTDAAGQYTIIGLSDGGYWVEFRPPEQLEFFSQYFDGEPGLLQADTVEVQVGQLTPNVNATLLEAGQIAGRVTDAITHVPLAGIRACTSTTFGREWIGGCGTSGADGSYLIRRVPAGVYTVRFFTDETLAGDYQQREYTGICGNDPVAVTVAAGALTSGIDVGMFPSTSIGLSSPSCAALAQLPAVQTKKPRKCRKGTRRKVVRGKRRCVKLRKHRHRKHHTARRG